MATADQLERMAAYKKQQAAKQSALTTVRAAAPVAKATPTVVAKTTPTVVAKTTPTTVAAKTSAPAAPATDWTTQYFKKAANGQYTYNGAPVNQYVDQNGFVQQWSPSMKIYMVVGTGPKPTVATQELSTITYTRPNKNGPYYQSTPQGATPVLKYTDDNGFVQVWNPTSKIYEVQKTVPKPVPGVNPNETAPVQAPAPTPVAAPAGGGGYGAGGGATGGGGDIAPSYTNESEIVTDTVPTQTFDPSSLTAPLPVPSASPQQAALGLMQSSAPSSTVGSKLRIKPSSTGRAEVKTANPMINRPQAPRESTSLLSKSNRSYDPLRAYRNLRY